MVLIKWDKNLSVNVNQIDAQHQRLIDLMNQLHELMKSGQGRDSMALVLDDLMAYAGTHFKTEEDYFDKFDYEDKTAHKMEHAKFVEKVKAFRSDFMNGKMNLSIEVMNFMRDWLVNHINGTDKRYTHCFNEHGLR